jgi:hypothetical protein
MLLVHPIISFPALPNARRQVRELASVTWTPCSVIFPSVAAIPIVVPIFVVIVVVFHPCPDRCPDLLDEDPDKDRDEDQPEANSFL